ncbi:hydantoinase/oxoprolinase family protein [Aestuariivirga sp. YIM B02566]|uniref:Hydantoinase/oxoprolinase family protein n=1 Tax=Taklimakanibacter albus TaxID=2800327 RepID=A0ACC5R5A8_9HYPH|nr:hydantoinase/oxoprolinase family protein [Aestuariivirga sp. YIM B02566]MBK1867711.1 hydantoinase/oxoprolinase family protein [Aestuariivirga sp. YIM B02566]
MGLRIAIDTGGTFTDVVAIDEETGEIAAVKTPSTPADPSIGLVEGVQKILDTLDRGAEDVRMLLHGSTVATNAVLEHKFDGLGLLVTRGTRHMIEIARQSVPDGYGNSFFWVKPPRLVPLHLVREVPGRMRFDGSELEAIDEKATLKAVKELVEDGVRCIGVCLLHSYANGDHEQRIGELIRKNFPDVFVSLSSVVLPEYREYERAMTTLIDVLVKPYCKTYLQNAADKIKAKSGDIPFLIMQSNGGVVKHSTAGERPVTMLLSGPAAGILGSIHMAHLAGYKDILTIDVGGTSTDVAIIENYKPMYTSASMVESYPVKTPMLDIVTVGSGGGSIAWTDPYGSLKVGPRSAGADPGPICYRKGGTKPTVTDAAIVLGRLPAALIGGEIKLDLDAARKAYDELGRQFGMPAEEIAAGALEIAAVNQVFGIRQVTTSRGREPGQYAMVAFGGAGGLFAAEVADFLGIKTIISPPNPGNLCAFGLHVSDVRRDYIRTLVRQQSNASPDEIIEAWADLTKLGVDDIRAEGIPREKIMIQKVADLRYFGEGHEVQVDIPPELSDAEAIDYMWKNLHRVHDQTFGFHYEGEQDVELVNLRVQAVGTQHRPSLKQDIAMRKPAVPFAKRKVYWRGSGWVNCPLYRRTELAIGQKVEGPAVIEEYGSTVVVPASWTLRSDSYGNLILEKSA